MNTYNSRAHVAYNIKEKRTFSIETILSYLKNTFLFLKKYSSGKHGVRFSINMTREVYLDKEMVV